MTKSIIVGFCLWIGMIGVILGLTGCELPKGPEGSSGAVGPQGIQGEMGSKGDGGTQGSPGVAGKDGSKGDTGATGQQGTKGDPGTVGPTGADGKDGANGKDGSDGAQGLPGVNATPVIAVQFCPNYVTSYPGVFPEFGFIIGGKLYATYWDGHNAWTSQIPPGQYMSTSTSAPCDFTVNSDGSITN